MTPDLTTGRRHIWRLIHGVVDDHGPLAFATAGRWEPCPQTPAPKNSLCSLHRITFWMELKWSLFRRSGSFGWLHLTGRVSDSRPAWLAQLGLERGHLPVEIPLGDLSVLNGADQTVRATTPASMSRSKSVLGLVRRGALAQKSGDGRTLMSWLASFLTTLVYAGSPRQVVLGLRT